MCNFYSCYSHAHGQLLVETGSPAVYETCMDGPVHMTMHMLERKNKFPYCKQVTQTCGNGNRLATELIKTHNVILGMNFYMREKITN